MMIVIGGSLGGTKVLYGILRTLPKTFPHPIAIALHRSRDSQEDDGGVAELLQKASLLPVREPLDKEPILGGHVYLAPADYHLMVEPSGFSLSTDEPVQYARPSIDVLFESAADAFNGATVGVVLTGANQDGAHGAACIRDRGGLVVVQDPATAESPSMPQAAIRATGTSHIYAPREIGHFLARLGSEAESK
jgi:two-component system chemotaxis response regulator CheB